MRMRHERGQTVVVACLMVLVLSLATLATVNLGQTIQERIGLQNAADAAAYSTAAMEARAFNLYAFANRTQASHYVSAMAWQSLDSFIYFAEAFLTDFYGFLRTVDVCGGTPSAPWTLLCPALEALPGVGQIVRMVHALLAVVLVVVQSYQALLKSTDPDTVIGKDIVPAHWALNSLMAAASSAMMQSVFEQVKSTSAEVIVANAPNAAATTLGSAVSSCLFERAHYKEAIGLPSSPGSASNPLDPNAVKDDDRTARAKRVMGAIANGSRFSCDAPGCASTFVTRRTEAKAVPFASLLGKDKGHIHNGKLGQTRLLTTSYANGQGTAEERRLNYIRDWRDPPGYGIGALAQPDNLASDDIYWMKLGPLACRLDASDVTGCWGDPRKGKHERDDGALDQPYRYTVKTSVWALNDAEKVPGGLHWRVDYGNSCFGPECALGVTQSVGPKGIEVFTANVRPVQDQHHEWKGTAPFPHFEPGQFAADCSPSTTASMSNAAKQAEEFNQPSTWVTLTEATPWQPALLNSQGRITHNASLAMADPSVLHAMARAQTYYHRPGNWAEQPNFFNPYWRPRLASVYQGRAALPQNASLDAFLPGTPLQRVFTH
jgi:hypothetical protein